MARDPILEVAHCRDLGTHDDHVFERDDKQLWCPGMAHWPHTDRCCTQHNTHSMPHKGCILR